jgi:hypothetical protein
MNLAQRIARIEAYLGLTPAKKTLAIGEHWTLTRLDQDYLRMVTYHQMDGYLMCCWTSTPVAGAQYTQEVVTSVRLEQADGFADAKGLLDIGFKPDTTHGWIALPEVPWPLEPVTPGPRELDLEEREAEMATVPGYQDQEPETLEPDIQAAMDTAFSWPDEEAEVPEPVNQELLAFAQEIEADIQELYEYLDDSCELSDRLDLLATYFSIFWRRFLDLKTRDRAGANPDTPRSLVTDVPTIEETEDLSSRSVAFEDRPDSKPGTIASLTPGQRVRRADRVEGTVLEVNNIRARVQWDDRIEKDGRLVKGRRTWVTFKKLSVIQ